MSEFASFNEKNKCISREDINKITGFNPINVLFYQKAFIHKSVLRFLADQKEESLKTSYERYEFLGDSVLNLIVANYIFDKYPDKEEGFLTRIRTKLVNGKTLAFLSKKINLLTDLILSIQLINTTDTKIPEYHYKCIFDKIDNLDTNDETTIEFLTDFIQFNIELFTI